MVSGVDVGATFADGIWISESVRCHFEMVLSSGGCSEIGAFVSEAVGSSSGDVEREMDTVALLFFPHFILWMTCASTNSAFQCPEQSLRSGCAVSMS